MAGKYIREILVSVEIKQDSVLPNAKLKLFLLTICDMNVTPLDREAVSILCLEHNENHCSARACEAK